jgi:hypothetical protein
MNADALHGRLAPMMALLAATIFATSLTSAAAAADKSALPLPREGFACCNLHYERDWINDGNYASLAMLPAGTPIKVVSLGRHLAYVELGGKKMRLGHDYGREQESLEQWVSKIVVLEDPAPRIAAYPPDVQAAIKEGRVALGMTREQAIVAVGYPLTSENPSLDAPVWRHWVSSFEEYQLSWGPDGHLTDFTGSPAVRARMLHERAK